MEGKPIETVVVLPFDEALTRIREVVGSADMTVFASIDHAVAARDIGIVMRPVVVLLYGNPRGGTPAMIAAPRVALDLPLRVLVRDAGGGRIVLSHHPIGPLLRDAAVPESLAMRLESAEQTVMRGSTR